MSAAPLCYRVASLSETEALAQRVAALAVPGDVIALHGGMGAGKSVFARAFIRARARNPALEVPSPSFALMHLYTLDTGDIAHYDLWRLHDPEGLRELDWEGEPPRIMVVEWPENAGVYLPANALHIHVAPLDGPDSSETALWEESAPREFRLDGWPERRI